MPDFSTSRRKLKIAIGAMVAADVIAIGVLFSPLVGSSDSRQLQLNLLRVELTKKNHDVEPLRNIDKKLVLAKEQISGFYRDRFAARDSDLANELGKIGSPERRPHPAGKIQGRGSRNFRRCSRDHRGEFLRQLSATGSFHQHSRTFEGIF